MGTRRGTHSDQESPNPSKPSVGSWNLAWCEAFGEDCLTLNVWTPDVDDAKVPCSCGSMAVAS